MINVELAKKSLMLGSLYTVNEAPPSEDVDIEDTGEPPEEDTPDTVDEDDTEGGDTQRVVTMLKVVTNTKEKPRPTVRRRSAYTLSTPSWSSRVKNYRT